jgi:predicted amidohydrolase YtcJ
MRILITTILSIAFFSACKNRNDQTEPPADTIYTNGKIITMESDSPRYVTALTVTRGIISFAGDEKEAMNFQGDSTRVIDLAGKTLLPGFIDAHGHVDGYANFSQFINLMPEPYGTVMSIPLLQQALRNYIRENKIPPGTPVTGSGYDESVMTEHRHPTATELDAVSTEHPIYIIHVSGHMGVANSLLLQKAGISYNTPDPPGGNIGKDPSKHTLTGKMIENANIDMLVRLYGMMPHTPNASPFKALLAAEKEWLANGQTTICEGRSTMATVRLLQKAAENGLLSADIISLPDYDACKDSLTILKNLSELKGHFRIGAIKMTFDGSPQGKSAWLTEPYLIPPDGEKPGFRGHSIYQREAAYNALKDIFSHHMPVHIHCNGDAAIDEAFLLIDSLQQQQLQPKELRNVLVHAQVCRPDQVKIFKKLNIIPSWFPTHTYLWGDWYLNSVLGLPRAAHISPLKDGLDNGILFTIHHDSPVTPPDLITAVYAAVNRTTRSGKILGADQRVSPYEALKAITINAAYQYGEEASKGSLVKGKRADLVILDQDPLQINPQALKDIRVIETIKDGISVYKRVP